MTYNTIKATEKDGAQMLKLFEQSEIRAPIEMILTRRPNAVLSYKKENKDARIFLVKSDNEIILQVACLVHELFVDGKPARVGYLCGLRKKSGIFRINYSELTQTIFDECKCDVYYANIIDGNPRATKFLTKGHSQLPSFHPLCKYTSFVFRIKKTKTSNEFVFRRAGGMDNSRIAKFLQEQRQEHNLFPSFDLNQFANLNIGDFYLLEQNNEILCVCALWWQEGFKQYMVKRYNGIVRAFSFLPAFPKVNEVIKNPIISFFIAKNENTKYYKEMLKRIGNVIKPKSKLYTVGAIQNSILYEILSKKMNAARFDSTIYTINKPLSGEKIHIEGGLL